MDFKRIINKYLLRKSKESFLIEEDLQKENKSELDILCEDNNITFFDGRSCYPYDSEFDDPDLKRIGNPILTSATLSSDDAKHDIIIANAIMGGSYKMGYLEFDLVLRYKPSHFSWGGCYSHYFLHGKFTGDIRRTDTKSMYSWEIECLERCTGPQLFDRQIKPLGVLAEALELKLNTKLLDKEELPNIYR